MKKIIKQAVSIILGAFLISGFTLAQEPQFPCRAPGYGAGVAANFTDQQKEMLKQISEKKKSFKQEFQETVSQEQKDILEDPRLLPVERKKEFSASFTDEQVKMIKSHNAEIKKMREEIRASVTPEQKAALQKGNKNQGKYARRPGPGAGMYCPCCPCRKL